MKDGGRIGRGLIGGGRKGRFGELGLVVPLAGPRPGIWRLEAFGFSLGCGLGRGTTCASVVFAGEVSRSRSGFGAGETDRVEGVEVASPGLFKFSNLARREETGRCSWSFSMQGRKRAGGGLRPRAKEGGFTPKGVVE